MYYSNKLSIRNVDGNALYYNLPILLYFSSIAARWQQLLKYNSRNTMLYHETTRVKKTYWLLKEWLIDHLKNTLTWHILLVLITIYNLLHRAGLWTRDIRRVPRAPGRERAPRRPLIINFFVIQKWVNITIKTLQGNLKLQNYMYVHTALHSTRHQYLTTYLVLTFGER